MTARTPAGTPPPAARITILDILRALALLGIVIVHTHDHFNLYLPMPPAEGWQAAANSAADWAYEQAGATGNRLPETLHVAPDAPVPAGSGAYPVL